MSTFHTAIHRRTAPLLLAALLLVMGAGAAHARPHPSWKSRVGQARAMLGGAIRSVPAAPVTFIPPEAEPAPFGVYLVAFATEVRGQYLALADSGTSVVANRTLAGTWGTFMLKDLTRTTLSNGDVVNLADRENHRFVTAEGGGGREVTCNRTHHGAWEEITLIRLNGSGPIRDGDVVALRTKDGHYLSAVGGGGAGVVATATTVGPWEQFKIEIRHRGP